MANYRNVARVYYNAFEWPGWRHILRSWAFWFFLASLAIFIYTFFILSVEASTKLSRIRHIPHNERLLIIIATEILCLGSWFVFQFKKYTYLLKRAQRSQDLRDAPLRLLKRHALSTYLQVRSTEFADIAKKIGAAAALEQSVADPRDYSLRAILGYIYSPDSKPRIYTLLGALIAIITALSIKNGASLAGIKNWYSGYSALALLLTDFLISILIGLLFVIVKHAISFITISIDVFTTQMDGKRGESQHMTNYLIRDLLRLHTAIHLKSPAHVTSDRGNKRAQA
ncbi:hypothetical protein [Thiomonas intermedia]|uniref:hypothetical protein n=1 Tax=Thiomonas intermedia TaxID=926 RepID=UPI0012AC2EB1|nr:hypothetical protein [Thiomonas intermedia]